MILVTDIIHKYYDTMLIVFHSEIKNLHGEKSQQNAITRGCNIVWKAINSGTEVTARVPSNRKQ